MTKESVFEIEEQNFELGILEPNDIDDLIEVSAQWVRNRFNGRVEYEELRVIRENMQSSLRSDKYTYIYYVLRDEQRKAIGCCTLREPEERMQKYKTTYDTKSKELVNVFLHKDYRKQGLGRKLIEYTFTKAKEDGYEEVIWNSGMRYETSAWDFYKK